MNFAAATRNFDFPRLNFAARREQRAAKAADYFQFRIRLVKYSKSNLSMPGCGRLV